MNICIFCRLYREKTNIVYETETVFVLVDRNPLATGHLIVVPKVHRPYFHMHTPEELCEVLEVVRHLVGRLGLEKYNLLQNNANHQSILHVHFHIIPFVSENERLRISWETIPLSNEEYSKRVAETRRMLSDQN